MVGYGLQEVWVMGVLTGMLQSGRNRDILIDALHIVKRPAQLPTRGALVFSPDTIR